MTFPSAADRNKNGDALSSSLVTEKLERAGSLRYLMPVFAQFAFDLYYLGNTLK
jgi:hypothetical protein